MPVIVSKKLICVSAEKVSWQGREGKQIEKYKYMFLDKDMNLIQGFLDSPDYVQDVQQIENGVFEEAKAKTYLFEKRFFQGKTTDKLMPRKN